MKELMKFLWTLYMRFMSIFAWEAILRQNISQNPIFFALLWAQIAQVYSSKLENVYIHSTVPFYVVIITVGVMGTPGQMCTHSKCTVGKIIGNKNILYEKHTIQLPELA